MEATKALLGKYYEVVVGALIVYFIMDIIIKPTVNAVRLKLALAIKSFWKSTKRLVGRAKGQIGFNEIIEIERKINAGEEVSERQKAAYERMRKAVEDAFTKQQIKRAADSNTKHPNKK